MSGQSLGKPNGGARPTPARLPRAQLDGSCSCSEQPSRSEREGVLDSAIGEDSTTIQRDRRAEARTDGASIR